MSQATELLPDEAGAAAASVTSASAVAVAAVAEEAAKKEPSLPRRRRQRPDKQQPASVGGAGSAPPPAAAAAAAGGATAGGATAAGGNPTASDAETNLCSRTEENNAAFVQAAVVMNGGGELRNMFKQQQQQQLDEETSDVDEDHGSEGEAVEGKIDHDDDHDHDDDDDNELAMQPATKRTKLVLDDDDDDDDDTGGNVDTGSICVKGSSSSSSSSSFDPLDDDFDSAFARFHNHCLDTYNRMALAAKVERTRCKHYRSPRLENLSENYKTISSFKVDIGKSSRHQKKKKWHSNLHIRSQHVRLGLLALQQQQQQQQQQPSAAAASTAAAAAATGDTAGGVGTTRRRQNQEDNHPNSRRRCCCWFNDNPDVMMKSREIPDDFLSMCSKRLQNDPSFVCYIIRRRVDHFRLDFLDAVKVLDHCHRNIFDDERSYEYLNDEFERELNCDKSRVGFNAFLSSRIGPTLLDNSYFMLRCVNEWCDGVRANIYGRVSDRLKDDEKFILSSITETESKLQRRPRGTVTVGALPYASDRLKSDPSFMLRAQTKFLEHANKSIVRPTYGGGDVLCYASRVLFDDERFMLEMHKKIHTRHKTGFFNSADDVVKLASVRLKNDASFILKIFEVTPCTTATYVGAKLLRDKSFVMKLLEKQDYRRALASVSDKLQNDVDVCRKAIHVWSDHFTDRLATGHVEFGSQFNTSPLKYCGNRVTAIRDIVKSSVAVDPVSIRYASSELQSDEVLALFALKSVRDSVFIENWDVSKFSRRVFQFLPASLRSSADFVTKAVELCPYLLIDLQYLKNSRNYLDIVVVALGCNNDRDGEKDFWVERYGRHEFYNRLRAFWSRSFYFSDLQESIQKLHIELLILGGDNASLSPLLDDRTYGWRLRYDGFSTGRLDINEWKCRQWEKTLLTDRICSSACRRPTGIVSAASAEKFPSEVLRRIVEFTGTDQLLKRASRIESLEPLINKMLERSLMVPTVPTDGMGGIHVNGEDDWEYLSDSDDDNGDDDDEGDDVNIWNDPLMDDESVHSFEEENSYVGFTSDDDSDGDDFELEEDASDVDSDDVDEMEEGECDFDSDEFSGDY